MAISVTTNYHNIYPPTQLTKKLIEIASAGALAKLLEQEKLYNDLKSLYNNVKDQWEIPTREMCKKKSKTNWLGGGDIYACLSCEDWDSAIGPFVFGFDNRSKQELIEMLNSTIRKLNSKY